MKKGKRVLLLTLFFASMMCFKFCKQIETKSKSSNVTGRDEILFNKDKQLKAKNFDTIIDKKKIKLYWIENENIKVAISNYGGRIIGLWTLNKDGEYSDVVVGMGSIHDYINSSEPYFGALIGRVANRISKGKFTINEKEYLVPINNGKNTLHGGNGGFHNVVWDAKQTNDTTLFLSYLSPNMEEGFPGNLKTKVTYSLIDGNTVKMEYEAATDKTTIVNLTNHAFFNLNGEGSGTILNHTLQIYADKFTPVDKDLIPTGELKDVSRTPFDFRSPRTIGERIDAEKEQLINGGGYDHNYVLSKIKINGMSHAATAIGDRSGIRMDVYTQEPGLQFYSGNFMQGKNQFKSGAKDEYRTAFALETQHFPDAVNKKNFPPIILDPRRKYHSVSLYRFSIDKELE